jgi:TPR repeat protein
VTGAGVPAEPETAARWYLTAANSGHPDAQYRIGYFNETGFGVAEDAAKAVSWYQQAARQDHPEAQARLGVMLFEGRGVAGPDQAAAVEWFKLAASSEQIDAQTNLGLAYLHGLGIAPDRTKAVRWLSRAGLKEDPRAEEALVDALEQHLAAGGTLASLLDQAPEFRDYLEQNNPAALPQ